MRGSGKGTIIVYNAIIKVINNPLLHFYCDFLPSSAERKRFHIVLANGWRWKTRLRGDFYIRTELWSSVSRRERTAMVWASAPERPPSFINPVSTRPRFLIAKRHTYAAPPPPKLRGAVAASWQARRTGPTPSRPARPALPCGSRSTGKRIRASAQKIHRNYGSTERV